MTDESSTDATGAHETSADPARAVATAGPIDSIAALEDVMGKTPPAMNLKVIDHLDAGALRWIGASPLMFAGFGDASGIAITLGGGAVGFAGGSVHQLRIPAALLDDASIAVVGLGFGGLFVLPGTTETLRVNGRVTAVGDDIAIAVDECYGHCGKAMIRSELWAAAPAVVTGAVPAIVAASRFMALATIDAQGRADISPKGDPAGTMALHDGARLWFADRPGNRRTDSFRNVIAQPRMAAALLIPGSAQVAYAAGTAQITTDAAMRGRFAVQGKVPAVVTAVSDLVITVRESPALVRARLWPVQVGDHGIAAAQLFIAHIKRNKQPGLEAKLARAALAVPGMGGIMQRGLDKDYEENLY